MNAFVALIHLDRENIAPAILDDWSRHAEMLFGCPIDWTNDGWITAGVIRSAVIGATNEQRQADDCAFAETAQDVGAVGCMRLDPINHHAALRSDIEERRNRLPLIRSIIEEHARIQEIIGEFAFVSWHRRSREVFAARDSLGVNELFTATPVRRVLAIGSHAQLLSRKSGFDKEYLGEFLVNGYAPAGLSPFQDVRSVKPGSFVSLTGPRLDEQRYWSATVRTSNPSLDTTAAVARFRELFSTAVAAAIHPQGGSWAMLSGGLDSSSIVVMATELRDRRGIDAPLQGTLTLVDSAGRSGDERAFSDTVAGVCGLPNAQFDEWWLWQSDGESPPSVDQPYLMYPYYARDRRVSRYVRAMGGRRIITGIGADHYLTGSKLFLSDLVAQGQFRVLLREALNWAVEERTSIWHNLWRHAILPATPGIIRRRVAPRARRTPWIRAELRAEYELDQRTMRTRSLAGDAGQKYAYEIAFQLAGLPQVLRSALDTDGVDLRHPFLYRPLVDFSLALPYSLRTRPHARKWILREAMRDLLPETVRQRRTKGNVSGSIRWSFVRERAVVAELLRSPILADLGCIEPRVALAYLDEIEKGRSRGIVTMLACLSLEFWLRVSTGRWAAGETYFTPSRRSA